MLKKLLVAVSIMMVPVMAHAGDMGMPMKSAGYAASYNWNGFYAGAVAGGGYMQNIDPGYYYDGAYATVDSGIGAAVGGTLGYNVQSGNFIYGR